MIDNIGSYDFPGRPIYTENLKKLFKPPSVWIPVVLISMAKAGNIGIFSVLPRLFQSVGRF